MRRFVFVWMDGLWRRGFGVGGCGLEGGGWSGGLVFGGCGLEWGVGNWKVGKLETNSIHLSNPPPLRFTNFHPSESIQNNPQSSVSNS